MSPAELAPEARVAGELRRVKGAWIFVPVGFDHYLRVDGVTLAENVQSAKVTAVLVARAIDVRAPRGREEGLHPDHGVPERATGRVRAVHAGSIVLDVDGLPLVVEVSGHAPSVGKPATALLAPPLRVEAVEG